MRDSFAVPCQCSIERKITAALPERYRQARLRDFPGDIGIPVTQWLGNPTDGLFVTGPAGTGKTYLAAAMVRRLMENHASVKFLRCAQLFADIRETYRTNAPEESVLGPLDKPRFLILDDLGAGSLSDHERRFTLEVLDRRLNGMRATVVTTNWSLQQIAERMDDRIASRLSTFLAVEIAGNDRRLHR